MDWIWKPFATVQEAVDQIEESKEYPDEGTALCAGEATPRSLKSIPHLEEINDHIYEVHKPAGRPSVELVFFHGLQLDAGSSGEAHINTWTSRDKSECWLTWLLDDIPDARILTVSYDGGARTTGRHGRMDLYVTSENLVHALTGDAARVGQDGCPVVFVGHCLGGLVMKELCCQAQHMIRLGNHSKAMERFLDSIKGFFFFATPHHGSLLANSNKKSLNAPLVKVLRTLNVQTARQNEDFRQLRMARGWKTYGVVGLLPMSMKNFEGVVVPEASARSDMDYFYAAPVDHYSVCRPVNKQSTTFQLLSDFAHRFMTEWQQASNDLELNTEYVQVDIPGEDKVTLGYPECSPLGLLALKMVMLTVVVTHVLMFPVIFGVGAFMMDRAAQSDTLDDSSSTWIGIYPITSFILLILNALSLIVTPTVCASLLRFCMTGRSAGRGQLMAELEYAPGCDQVLEMCIHGFCRFWIPLSSQQVDLEPQCLAEVQLEQP